MISIGDISDQNPNVRAQREAPLDGVLVLELAQFLSGPSAALRLGDLGARVIKIERPDGGDIGRQLYLTDVEVGGESTLFHAINRNKESVAVDLKTPEGCAVVHRLFTHADVVIENFRPGAIDRLGLGFDEAIRANPKIVFASITGYGPSGPWAEFPGQDLLAQAVSGMMWLNGDGNQGPVPFGLAVTDMLAGHGLVEGILAGLFQRERTGRGMRVETSLLEAALDFQFEVLTTYLNNNQSLPKRAEVNNAHAFLGAPYGVYKTADGFLALAMSPLEKIADIFGDNDLTLLSYDKRNLFSQRDEIKRLVSRNLVRRNTQEALSILRSADIWCAPVMNWPQLLSEEAFKRLDMLQTVSRPDGTVVRTTRSPLKIDGVRPSAVVAAPRVGEHTDAVFREFDLWNCS